ncbi:MAG TPA: hypothetical protein VE422_47600 [Terriglobia bacterium]|nr:hypothetical protein [Terriglobia bacterium]
MPKSRKKASVEELSAQAQFVFRGTVRQRGAATLDQVALSRETLIVGVEEILKSPDVLMDFEGMDITVQLARGQRVEVGKTYIFYTNGWLYGQGLAVQCVALSPDADVDRRKARVSLEAAPARAVQERAKRAELVVTGQVTEVREASPPAKTPITEHDPAWQQAVVAVDTVEQTASRAVRKPKPKQIVVRFASSFDVLWSKAPKFSVGQAGVWMLGDKQEGAKLRAAAGAQKSEFVVVDPEDFYPMESAEQVKALLKK